MRSRAAVTVPLTFVIAALASCASPEDSTSQGSENAANGATQECEPLETRDPNVPDQEPAFEGQTRACGIDSEVEFDVAVVADGLEHPWAVEPLPDGDLLVTERPGRMRIVSLGGTVGDPIAGLPDVNASGQGGLLDVALSPDFESDRTLFWSYAEPRDGGNGTSVARGVLSPDRRTLQQVQVILRAQPTYDGRLHYGSRLAFGPDGMLYVTTGERSDASMRQHAQQTDNHLGKVLRIAPDGSVPADNPFANQADAQPELWSIGHRNIQAATFDPQGRLWVIEHGAQGGDEVNLIEAGENYGWPIQAYGEEYSGQPIPTASPAPGGFQQPVYYWDPVIAPSGAEWYTGDAFPEWRGSLFVGALREQRLVRLVIEDERVTAEEHLLTDRGQRIRDVRQGPDGTIFLVTDEENGRLLRLTPT